MWSTRPCRGIASSEAQQLMFSGCLQLVHSHSVSALSLTPRHSPVCSLVPGALHLNGQRHRQGLSRPYTFCFAVQQHHSVRNSKRRADFATCRAALPEVLGYLSGVCFDQQCQQAADRAFLIVTSIPLLGLVCAIIIKFRPPSAQALSKAEVFNDPATETYFEGPAGTTPERDRKGQLAFRAMSYTPWPVEEGQPGERLRIDVGPTSLTSPRTFVFDKKLGAASSILAVKLPRPMGIIFEEDKAKGQAVIAEFVEGSAAEQRSKLAKMNQQSNSGPRVGDLLRACTCTNLVYPTRSLLGVKAPVRTIVVYGADGQKWPKVMAALKAGARADGDVTLILERRSS